MRIREYIDVVSAIEEFKEEFPNSKLFGKGKEVKGVRNFTKFLKENKEGLIRAENGKIKRDMEKRKRIR